MPRSTDYPSMGFDLLDGLKLNPVLAGTDLKLFTENIGFGDDHSLTYAKAEKMLLQDDVQIIVAYNNIQNAEHLYALANSSGKAFIFLDSGMQMPIEDKQSGNWFISLQGLLACSVLGKLIGENEKKVLVASSLFDAGFRGLLFAERSFSKLGSEITSHYVSTHKISEFSLDIFFDLVNAHEDQCVFANFSIYLNELFLNGLAAAKVKLKNIKFYCSPFMAEEQNLAKCSFPGGELNTIVPWALSLENKEQMLFKETIQKQKNKNANIFHLLGWEAAFVVMQIINNGSGSLGDWSYDSPRGKVTFDPKTQTTYAPLYRGMIIPNEEDKCTVRIDNKIEITAEEHEKICLEKQEGHHSNWKNNYFCA